MLVVIPGVFFTRRAMMNSYKYAYTFDTLFVGMATWNACSHRVILKSTAVEWTGRKEGRVAHVTVTNAIRPADVNGDDEFKQFNCCISSVDNTGSVSTSGVVTASVVVPVDNT
ncbi:hypothetical protein Tco_1159780, partial [Tanacetum coccineum]